MPYIFIEDIALADVAFRAEGRTLSELFGSAAEATEVVMVRNIDKVERKVERKIVLEAGDVERLLFDFLQELVFYKDAELLLFSKYDVSIEHVDEKFRLEANVYGEEIDMKKHNLIADVKAVTMHRFEVRQTADGWQATVVLDI
ncbi:MAG: archease [Thaumarchaeota archaeon]|nr:archease [Nitrososphaerota archaeon]